MCGNLKYNDLIFFGIKDGVVSVQIQILEDRLKGAQEQRTNAIDVIHESQKELDKLKEE